MAVGMAAVWQGSAKGTLEPRRLVVKARWAMQDYLRLVRPDKRRKRVLRGDAEVVLMSLDVLKDDGVFEPEEPRPRTDELAAQHERALALRAALKQLPKRTRYAVKRRLDGWTNARIAKKLGVTEPRVSQLIIVATERLRIAIAR